MDAAHADSEGGRSRAWWDALSCIPVRTRVAQGQGHTGMGVGNSLLPAARGGMEAQRKGSGRIFLVRPQICGCSIVWNVLMGSGEQDRVWVIPESPGISGNVLRQEKGTPFSTPCPSQVVMPRIWDSAFPRKWETAFSPQSFPAHFPRRNSGLEHLSHHSQWKTRLLDPLCSFLRSCTQTWDVLSFTLGWQRAPSPCSTPLEEQEKAGAGQQKGKRLG